MAECCTLTKRGSKQTREPAIHYDQSIIGFGMLMKLMRYLRQIWIGFRLAYEDYVLLLLIASAAWMRWSALRLMWD
jgi:hypothetical protein